MYAFTLKQHVIFYAAKIDGKAVRSPREYSYQKACICIHPEKDAIFLYVIVQQSIYENMTLFICFGGGFRR